ncbi:MAG: NAD-dependent epimerase/dehydratase family protein [Bacilli bacterium]|jgi:nucleoside-diphosphate-sugar epimerase|nr:NAD(P)-dependent oxidoreductase [Bacilli bacterium]
MKILLTGAAGTVGHHVLKQLLDHNYQVTVIELKTKKNLKALKPYHQQITLIWGNITDSDLLNKIIKDQDVVIHLAGLIPPYADSWPELTRQVNYFGTKNIVSAITKYNPTCFLMFSSSISVYGDRLNNYQIKVGDKLKNSDGDYYALVKIQTEDMIKKSNINHTIFRLTAIMDKPQIDPLMFHMPLDTKLEIATARDTARAFVNGIKHKGILNKNIYNLGGGKKCRTTYREFLKTCFKIYGLNYNYLDESAFADKNFHCGYYIDGHILNDIVNFQEDTLDSYYQYLSDNTSVIKKNLTKALSYFIMWRLNSSSEPKYALQTNNKVLIKRFFK